ARRTGRRRRVGQPGADAALADPGAPRLHHRRPVPARPGAPGAAPGRAPARAGPGRARSGLRRLQVHGCRPRPRAEPRGPRAGRGALRHPRPADLKGDPPMTPPRWLRIGLVAALALAMSVTPALAQKRGGTLTIVRPTDPVSLDPQLETTAPGAWVYYNILEPLLTLDEKMQIQLKLASSYEVLSPTKVRFKLRQGVKF